VRGIIWLRLDRRPLTGVQVPPMDLMQSFDAILFPADGRPPHVVSLMTSPASFSNPHAPAQTSTARIPHPEVHMEYIAEDPNMRAWNYFVRAFFFQSRICRCAHWDVMATPTTHLNDDDAYCYHSSLSKLSI
jgi:hypothetical protein